MKTTLFLLTSLASAAIAAPAMTDRITPEEIAARQKSAPAATLVQPVAGAEAKVARPGEQSLIKQSDILSDGNNWTLVPKGAVLHTPAAMSNRVGAKPVGTLLSWTDFLTVNRGWLFTENENLSSPRHPPLLPRPCRGRRIRQLHPPAAKDHRRRLVDARGTGRQRPVTTPA